MRMPIPMAPVSDLDEQATSIPDSHYHLGGTSSAPTIPTLHDRTREMSDSGGRVNRFGQLLGHASTRLSHSVKATGFHDRYSAHVRDRAVSEGSGRFAGSNLLGRSAQRGVNLSSAGSELDSGSFRHGVHDVSQSDVRRPTAVCARAENLTIEIDRLRPTSERSGACSMERCRTFGSQTFSSESMAYLSESLSRSSGSCSLVRKANM